MPTHRDLQPKESTPKHDIVVVADGQTIIKGDSRLPVCCQAKVKEVLRVF